MIARTSAVVLLAGLIGVGLMRPGVPSPEPTVSAFLLAWESQHYLQAAELTTGNPKAVATELADAYQRLDASNLNLSMLSVSQQGKTAYARFNAAIDLGGSGLTWSYDNEFSLADGPHGWRVTWSPSVIVQGMTSTEQLAVVSYWSKRQQLLDSAGQSLAVPSTVYKVGVIPGRLADPEQTADGLAAVTKLSAEQIEGQMDEGPSGVFLPLLTLSPTAYAEMRPKLGGIPGLQFRHNTELLFQSIAPDVVGSVGTETASVLRTDGVQYRPGTTVGLTGLQETFQRQLTGTPETEVLLQEIKSGLPAVTLQTWPGSAGKPVHTTLNANVQLAADHAVAHIPASAAVVAVQAGTGKILAVASHTPKGTPGLQPLWGQYQPGQAFTIVSSAAILSKGLSPRATVPCHSVNSVGGRTFRNEPPVPNLGASSFRTDFAHACSTAFAGGLALDLPTIDLMKASQDFGIGGWQLPVSSYFAGKIGQPSGEGMLAADMIGRGDVEVSPLGMALAAAVVASGKWHGPSLVTDPSLVAGPADSTRRGTVSPQVLTELRGMMRDAARTGPNAAADIGGDVYAQTGSAPYGSAHLWTNWFVGYRGDVAFAVVELGRSASASVSSLAGSFLQNIQAGS
jgi:cell division protein FtsI/penicillin-binding protein 2